MSIKSINVKNTRGISSFHCKSEIVRNRPNILVAPNGFGKSSLARAFQNASKQTFLKVQQEDRHQNNAENISELEIEVDLGAGPVTLKATETAHTNDIRKTFDIFVISDLRKVKATAQNFGGFAHSRGSLVIDPVVICDKPDRVQVPEGILSVKAAFGGHNGLLGSFADTLGNHDEFIRRSLEILGLLDSLLKPRRNGKIELIHDKLSSLTIPDLEALNSCHPEINLLKVEDEEFGLAIEFLKNTCGCDEGVAFVYLWHLLRLAKVDRDHLEGLLRWERYSHFKGTLQSVLDGLNTTIWKKTVLKESHGKLIALLPYPKDISNGQRDVVVLTCMLYSARIQLEKNNAILVIDEVFDYLDDANLTVAQFYVSQIIQDYKKQGRSIYPMVLTHLNPEFFRNYVFSNQKVIHLENSGTLDATPAMKKMIGARNDTNAPESLKDKISLYLVHYHNEAYDFQSELSTIAGVRGSWGRSGEFDRFLREEFGKYKAGEAYDPLAICALTRRRIEERAFLQIRQLPGAADFFSTHKTAPKLEFATKNGAEVPESHFLLRIIFDDGMHWDPGRNSLVPIIAKLSNPIIRRMVIESIE